MLIDNSLQEYLSKPLKQNQLVQTILKCAAMSGSLIAPKDQHIPARSTKGKSNQLQPESQQVTATPSSKSILLPAQQQQQQQHQLHHEQRPSLEMRSATAVAPVGMDSPCIVTTDQEDPLERLMLRAHSS